MLATLRQRGGAAEARFACAALLVAFLALGSTAKSRADEASELVRQFQTDIQPLLVKYCVQCHGGSEPEADLRLDDFEALSAFQTSRETWLDVLTMVDQQQMPPDEMPEPSDGDREKVVQWIELCLATLDCREKVYPGRVAIRRLNVAEYRNTIRDLVGVDYEPTEDFPPDDVGHGFDNMGDVLSISPLLMEKYFAASEAIVDELMKQPRLRRQIITARPDSRTSRQQCIERVLRQFASRAFRRPASDSELRRLMRLAELAELNSGHNYENSVAFAIQAVLTSPRFLFRIERDADPQDPDVNRKLTSYEVATRLAYFLWSSMPDDELFELAKRGQLSDDQVLARQVQRMLGDPKSVALVDNFAAQWLKLRNLPMVAPDPDQFPTFDDQLRHAMRRETELLFTTIVSEDRSILDFIDSDYTFLNERLAEHYGIGSVRGDRFRRVALSDDRRGGLLTHASVLTLTSNPTRTSPVKRGLWILENILGTPPPPPPPDIAELADGDDVELLGTLRQRMEQHRSDPSCAVCHNQMDALGFGFENFDVIGSWRDVDGRFEIDPSGELPGGLSFRGPSELRALLKKEKQRDFTRCLTEKLLSYALGRGLESFDRCAIDAIIKEVEANQYRFSALVVAIVRSVPFRMRGSTGEL